MNVNTNCCDKEMRNLGDVDFANMNLNYCNRFICLECGKIIDISDYSLDDEELIKDLELYLSKDELKNSKLYNDLLEVEK
jgi:hypothetical protein